MDPGVCGPRGKLTRTVFNIHGCNEFSPACLSEKGERIKRSVRCTQMRTGLQKVIDIR